MLTKIKKVKVNLEANKPDYKVILESPKGKKLFIHFDYSSTTDKYWPHRVLYDGENKGTKLAWYTKEVEKTTVTEFLETIAKKINKKYGYEINADK